MHAPPPPPSPIPPRCYPPPRSTTPANVCQTVARVTWVTSSYSRLIDFVYHSTLGLRVRKKVTSEQVSSRQSRVAPPRASRRLDQSMQVQRTRFSERIVELRLSEEGSYVSKAHRRLYHSTRGLRVIKKKKTVRSVDGLQLGFSVRAVGFGLGLWV